MKIILNCAEKLLFPQKVTCLLCGAELFADEYLCPRCESAMPRLGASVCIKCGRNTPGGGVCEDCKAHSPEYDLARSVCSFVPPAQTLVYALKFGGKPYVTAHMAQQIAALALREGITADKVTGVPMGARSLRRRGYNQSYLLAAEVARLLKVDYAELLIKVKETKRQEQLNRAERAQNLKGAFRVCDRAAVKDSRVLVIDDVLTTGSTASEVAQKLKNAGAKEVIVLTFCSVDLENPFSTKNSVKK